MPVNKKRASEYAKQVEDLYEQLGFVGLYSTFKEKLLNFAAAVNFDSDELQDYINQVNVFWNPEYRYYMDDIVYVFDQTIAVANNYYGEWGRVHKQMDKVRAAESVVNSKLGNYGEAAVEFISEKWRTSVLERESWQQLAERFKTSIDGKVVFHAETLGRTMAKGYSRRLKKIQADIAEIKYYEYVGIIRGSTRPFCLACNGHHFSANEIRLSGNGQIGPVIQYCGGYNCHHDLEPDPDYTKEDAEKRGVDWGIIEKREGSRIIRFYGTDAMSRAYDGQKKKLAKQAKKKGKK